MWLIGSSYLRHGAIQQTGGMYWTGQHRQPGTLPCQQIVHGLADIMLCAHTPFMQTCYIMTLTGARCSCVSPAQKAGSFSSRNVALRKTSAYTSTFTDIFQATASSSCSSPWVCCAQPGACASQ